MSFEVRLTENAVRDIDDVRIYLVKADSVEAAALMLTGLEQALISLSELPFRGNYPKELDAFGITDYRELYFKPYRIIYEVAGNQVQVLGVFDGRRDLGSLLPKRLLRDRPS